MKYLFFLTVIFLSGCPLERANDCLTVMRCEEQTEMLCDKNDSGCGEDCHYYVVEHCYEACRESR